MCTGRTASERSSNGGKIAARSSRPPVELNWLFMLCILPCTPADAERMLVNLKPPKLDFLSSHTSMSNQHWCCHIYYTKQMLYLLLVSPAGSEYAERKGEKTFYPADDDLINLCVRCEASACSFIIRRGLGSGWSGGGNKAPCERVVLLWLFQSQRRKVLRHVICILFAKCGFATE